MQKQNQPRTKQGQFKTLKDAQQDKAAGRLAASIFIGFMVISCFFEAIVSYLIN